MEYNRAASVTGWVNEIRSAIVGVIEENEADATEG